ncbi:MAG: hypothetical protein WCA36_11165 [Pseudolabrys sp.]|jgi:hypothetical protein
MRKTILLGFATLFLAIASLVSNLIGVDAGPKPAVTSAAAQSQTTDVAKIKVFDSI